MQNYVYFQPCFINININKKWKKGFYFQDTRVGAVGYTWEEDKISAQPHPRQLPKKNT